MLRKQSEYWQTMYESEKARNAELEKSIRANRSRSQTPSRRSSSLIRRSNSPPLYTRPVSAKDKIKTIDVGVNTDLIGDYNTYITESELIKQNDIVSRPESCISNINNQHYYKAKIVPTGPGYLGYLDPPYRSQIPKSLLENNTARYPEYNSAEPRKDGSKSPIRKEEYIQVGIKPKEYKFDIKNEKKDQNTYHPKPLVYIPYTPDAKTLEDYCNNFKHKEQQKPPETAETLPEFMETNQPITNDLGKIYKVYLPPALQSPVISNPQSRSTSPDIVPIINPREKDQASIVTIPNNRPVISIQEYNEYGYDKNYEVPYPPRKQYKPKFGSRRSIRPKSSSSVRNEAESSIVYLSHPDAEIRIHKPYSTRKSFKPIVDINDTQFPSDLEEELEMLYHLYKTPFPTSAPPQRRTTTPEKPKQPPKQPKNDDRINERIIIQSTSVTINKPANFAITSSKEGRPVYYIFIFRLIQIDRYQ